MCGVTPGEGGDTEGEDGEEFEGVAGFGVVEGEQEGRAEQEEGDHGPSDDPGGIGLAAGPAREAEDTGEEPGEVEGGVGEGEGGLGGVLGGAPPGERDGEHLDARAEEHVGEAGEGERDPVADGMGADAVGGEAVEAGFELG